MPRTVGEYQGPTWEGRHLEIRLPVSGLERRPGCHPERSEGSLRPASQPLRGVYPERSAWAQGDRQYLQMSREGVSALLFLASHAIVEI